jgi:hypothetical protein
MGKKFAYLSFFKTMKIDYIYRQEYNVIYFPCIYCPGTATMDSQTSTWTCTRCSKKGNIINLIEYSKDNTFRRMYVPKKEQKSINAMLDRLSKKYPQEQRLLSLKDKVNTLINYYEKTP